MINKEDVWITIRYLEYVVETRKVIKLMEDVESGLSKRLPHSKVRITVPVKQASVMPYFLAEVQMVTLKRPAPKSHINGDTARKGLYSRELLKLNDEELESFLDSVAEGLALKLGDLSYFLKGTT